MVSGLSDVFQGLLPLFSAVFQGILPPLSAVLPYSYRNMMEAARGASFTIANLPKSSPS